jgi:aminopeptidase N
MAKFNLTILFWMLLGCAFQQTDALGETQQLSISDYKVQIKPNFLDQSIEGTTELTVKFDSSTRSAKISVNDLAIDAVESDSKDIQWKQVDKTLELTFSKSPKKLFIRYHGKPQQGLTWGKNFVYSAYFTCHWMICDESPGQKATLDLTLIAPKAFKATASGNFVSQEDEDSQLSRFHWHEDKPYSTYVFGFAVGQFHDATMIARGKKLQLLGVEDNRESLIKKFQDTKRALEFFEEKAGLPLQHSVYTQVLVPGSEAQENNAFAIIGKEELDPILTDPHEDWSFVHELSHQWWGNLLTCKSWQHGWLNEGITTFMTAAYKEQRWGRGQYLREIELAKKRWQKSIDAGFDKPLSFAGSYPSLGTQRGIMYYKAALFLDALRTEVGEKPFWLGLKNYTRKFAYQSVESKDFQTVMEETTKKNLAAIFNRWVY